MLERHETGHTRKKEKSQQALVFSLKRMKTPDSTISHKQKSMKPMSKPFISIATQVHYTIRMKSPNDQRRVLNIKSVRYEFEKKKNLERLGYDTKRGR